MHRLLIPKRAKTGRSRGQSYRDLLHTTFYAVSTACQWRNLPKDFWQCRTVYHYFHSSKRNGLWERIHTLLREHLRQFEGLERRASAAIIDSQSVKHTECCDTRGCDAGKRANRRKRHVLVDTPGWMLLVVVLSANLRTRTPPGNCWSGFGVGNAGATSTTSGPMAASPRPATVGGLSRLPRVHALRFRFTSDCSYPAPELFKSKDNAERWQLDIASSFPSNRGLGLRWPRQRIGKLKIAGWLVAAFLQLF